MNIELFEELYRKYYSVILEYCLSNLSYDMDSAADAADNVFMTLYNKWDRLIIGKNIKLWLYRTADNHIKKVIRKNRRYYDKVDHLDDFGELGNTLDLSYTDSYFAQEVSDEELISRVGDTITDEYRELFYLRYVEKKTLEDISKQLGIPYSTLRRRIGKMEVEIKRVVEKMFENNNI